MANFDLDKLIFPPGKKAKLDDDFDPGDSCKLDKEQGRKALLESMTELCDLQDRFYADNRRSLLLLFQAADAAGKDGTIKHVMSGINPQGCQVYSFKQPSSEDLDHDYLWRCTKCLPERGRIGIFNRSYYEEVLVVRVHPEYLAAQGLPPECGGKNIWKKRYRQINNFEAYLTENGTTVMKFFLNVSKDEQKKRFLERIDNPEKNWKFSSHDIDERGHWAEYREAYQDLFLNTSTAHAPWHIIPADHKWFAHLAVSTAIIKKLKELDPQYPVLSKEEQAKLQTARQRLLSEK